MSAKYSDVPVYISGGTIKKKSAQQNSETPATPSTQGISPFNTPGSSLFPSSSLFSSPAWMYAHCWERTRNTLGSSDYWLLTN